LNSERKVVEMFQGKACNNCQGQGLCKKVVLLIEGWDYFKHCFLNRRPGLFETVVLSIEVWVYL